VTESDAVLRRIERGGTIVCGVVALLAWVAARGRLDAPAGVIAGGALVAFSYRGIKSGVDLLTGVGDHATLGPNRRVKMVIGLVKFFTRYAILAGAAYVIMARLWLPPLAVVAGASSLVVAIAIEALRTNGRKLG
jgi:hypothetical protein